MSDTASVSHSTRNPNDGQLPLIGRFFPAPTGAKVPEIIALFWVVKILTTAGGEVASDWLKNWGNIGGGGTEVGLFAVALLVQACTRRYHAFSYWALAFAIAIGGTGLADFLHLDVGISYAGTSILWAVILAAVFGTWYRCEGTLSIHSITTQRREAFYWATVFSTFALGTALGDYTAASLNMGYLSSGLLFLALFLIPAIAWRWFGLNSITAFWVAYVLTRPLGASFSDWVSKPKIPGGVSGLNYGNGHTTIACAALVFVLVVYLAIRKPDLQGTLDASSNGLTSHQASNEALTAEENYSAG